MNPESIIFYNLFIYLVGFVLLLSLNNSVFKQLSGWISIVISVLGIIFSSSLQVPSTENFSISYNWLHLGDTRINFKILIDNQTYFMYILVQIIAFFVKLFSTKYLEHDDGINRYFAFLNLFVFSMLGLVLAGNLLQLYLFWELVGFCSYLLIGFWYTKKAANSAAIKAFLINRMGDAFLMVGIFLLFLIYGNLDFDAFIPENMDKTAFGFPFLTPEGLQTLAVLMVFGGVTAKSAQLPLQIWLPDAMEGPTPASALIHAATMVVAGVFLLGRISPIITADAGLVIALVGGLTSVLAAISAVFQYDIKKVLAYSTISQLGFMVAGIGMGAVGASFFHLATHAFFKAGLFLCAGAVINYMHHEQDMRKMGNLILKLPVVFYAYLICAASLIGLPFTSGFLSKDSLLNAAVAFGTKDGPINIKILIPVLMGITSFLTSFYMIRQLVMVFFQRQESPVDKIISSTKRTFDGAIKSFQDILNADNESLGEEKVINFVRNLGVFDVSVIGLAICSTWFLFSSNPFSFEDVWFLEVFQHDETHFTWIPWVVGVLFILALLISYNTTFEELRRFYLGEFKTGSQRKFYLLSKNHFYMDSLYKKLFFMFIKSNETVNSSHVDSINVKGVTSGKFEIAPYFQRIETNIVDRLITKITSIVLSLSEISSKIDDKIIDGLVLKISFGLKNLGDKIRKSQSGQIQLYLLGLVIIILCIVFIKILIF
ncbi:NADH-quinone oxidoreductase subunit 5 family protein [Lacihabitans soyangensis]|uniref:NADH-quinone oxidoreductase subunit L n=1 Tax=Lacihabitans soyangensis TaxID=869394 RepID=A0AAE3H676_9BACT|nr:NADH-quinone oxidoreductase subunit L [Lacihabitans soyangensis]MCP9765994.1 NADH-quinone oxidoreductase subunit L [Lacihabitans soyangensis]